METRVCYKCHQEKPLDDFYNSRTNKLGKSYCCKSCGRAYFRQLDKRPHRIKRRKEWLHSEAGRARLRELKREDYRQNKEKHIAQRSVQALVKQGIMFRQPCAICGDKETWGHHPDYSKPLEVIWLCRKHHAEEHRIDSPARKN